MSSQGSRQCSRCGSTSAARGCRPGSERAGFRGPRRNVGRSTNLTNTPIVLGLVGRVDVAVDEAGGDVEEAERGYPREIEVGTHI